MGTNEQIPKLPRGVRVRGEKLYLDFRYKGERFFEPLRLEATKANIKYAEVFLNGVKSEIVRGIFDFAATFPNSAKLKRVVNTVPTVGDLMDSWRKTTAKSLQPSSLRGYEMSIKNHVMPRWGATHVDEITPIAIAKWIATIGLKGKTIRNHLIPLRLVLGDAVINGHIKNNPLASIDVKRLIPDDQNDSDYVIEPFTPSEITAIVDKSAGQFKNLWQFAFWSGLRTSELMALQWGDIDFSNNTVRVQRALVEGKIKKPKTKSGLRDVYLLPAALHALNQQKQYTLLAGELVFNCGARNLWWSKWSLALRLAKLRHRPQYQTRHTYASMMVSAGESVYWVAKQMGHKDAAMVTRVYGQWLPTDKKNDAPRNVWDNYGT
jgi:integrase